MDPHCRIPGPSLSPRTHCCNLPHMGSLFAIIKFGPTTRRRRGRPLASNPTGRSTSRWRCKPELRARSSTRRTLLAPSIPQKGDLSRIVRPVSVFLSLVTSRSICHVHAFVTFDSVAAIVNIPAAPTQSRICQRRTIGCTVGTRVYRVVVVYQVLSISRLSLGSV